MSNVDVRERFRPIAQAHTKAGNRVFWVAMSFMLLCIPVMIALHSTPFVFVAVAVFGAICMVGGVLTPKLVCPACNQNPEQRPEHFCPECGHAALSERANLLGFRHCNHCAKTLWRSKGRPGYTIRFCAHCGAHLTNDGILSA